MTSIPTAPFSKSHQWNYQTEPLSSIPEYPHLPLDTSTASSFVGREISITRLTSIYRHLWLAGRKSHIRPLHKQVMLGREIIITEDPSMHLIWFENHIFLKPTPQALLCWEFWERYVCVEPSDQEGRGREKKRGVLFETACGFLLSYARLIRHPSDYRIAVAHHLVPDMGFEAWCLFARDIEDVCSRPNFVPAKRWEYGELRLSRLNWIYKFTLRGYSYFYVYTEYSRYFGKNFQLLLLGFAYCSVLLAAMQVVMSSKDAASWLLSWCLNFSLGVILFVFICAGGIVGLFCSLFTYHLVITLVDERKSKGKLHIA